MQVRLVNFSMINLYAQCLISKLLKFQSDFASTGIRVPATVPGGIYSDLRKAGVLPEDILYRFNDVAYRWVGKDNWTYFTTFDGIWKIL